MTFAPRGPDFEAFSLPESMAARMTLSPAPVESTASLTVRSSLMASEGSTGAAGVGRNTSANSRNSAYAYLG